MAKCERHPESVAGDFYVVNGECITCGTPHVIAPDLVGWAKDEKHCCWKKQPETAEELERAIEVIKVSEVGCHRYAGTDPAVMTQIGREFCDEDPNHSRKNKDKG